MWNWGYSSDDDDLPVSTSLGPGDEGEYSTAQGYKRRSQMNNTSDMNLPLASSAQMPAGYGGGQIGDRSVSNLRSEVGMMDDDEEMIAARRVIPPRQKPTQGVKELWRSMLDRINGVPKDLAGERMIYINNPPLNNPSKFCNNYVSTSKYNPVSFLPKFFTGTYHFISLVDGLHVLTPFILEQFSKYANVFFLFTACIQQIPNVSPTNQYTTIAPLSLVLLVAAFKEVQEDLVRAVPPPSSLGSCVLTHFLLAETTSIRCRTECSQVQGPRGVYF